MLCNREDAALKLAQRLSNRLYCDPLVMAIPRGGVVIGAVLARELGTDLDVVLSRKLRAPEQPELAIGAISEAGHVYLNEREEELLGSRDAYLGEERRHQLAEIAWRQKLYRSVRPPAPVTGRSVIVTDDGIATGATMMAALQVIRAQHPYEVIVAVPVAPLDRLADVRRGCDDLICLLTPRPFWSIAQFYEDFPPVDDEQVVELLRTHGFATKMAQTQES
jgi:putative phosphoribosyl transferase